MGASQGAVMRLEGMGALVSEGGAGDGGACAIIGPGAARRWWSRGMVCDGGCNRRQPNTVLAWRIYENQ